MSEEDRVPDLEAADAEALAALDATEAPAEIDPETEAALSASFGAAASRFPPLRERVLARLDALPAPRRRPERGTAMPLFGRHRGILFLLYASAALLLLTGYVGYWNLRRIQRTSLASETRIEVRNLAIVLRALHEPGRAPAAGGATLEVAVARLGISGDPYGNPFAGEARRVWSFGANGRDDRGAADDVVAAW